MFGGAVVVKIIFLFFLLVGNASACVGVDWSQVQVKDLTPGFLSSVKPDALIRALRAKQTIPVIERLLESGLDVNKGDYKQRPPVCLAARVYKNSTKMVEFLISKGANPLAVDVNGNNALHRISKYNPHLPLAKIFLKAGLSPDSKNRFKKTPRKLATKKSHFELLELFGSHDR